MNSIEIKPINLWTEKGLTTANKIVFVQAPYSFSDGTLDVSYALTDSSNKPLANGRITVPKAITNTWNQDDEIFDYVLTQLKLEKNS